MKRPSHTPSHCFCPKEWRHIPDMTGSYELDAVLRHNPNKDLPSRLELYLDREDPLYGPKTGYSGYHGYSGDD